MGNIYSGPFGDAMDAGLTTKAFRVFLEQGDGTDFNANNSVQKDHPSEDWTRNTGGGGAKIYRNDFDAASNGWGSWEAASDNSDAAQFRVRIKNSSLNWADFLLFDGGEFPVTASNGQIVEPQVLPAALDLTREGVAYVMMQGHNNISYRYKIYNGSGTSLATLNPGDGNHVAYSYDSGTNTFDVSGDLTFNNNSGGSWQVEEIKVFETDGGRLITQTTGVSVGVADNGSITFTKVENDIQL